MISFNDFTKSRNLTQIHFSTMSYQGLVSFCKSRSVKPPSYADFLLFPKSVPPHVIPQQVVDTKASISIDAQTIELPYHPLDFDKLKKQKKATLQYFCEQRSIEYTDSTTKRELVVLLKLFENIHE